MIVLSMATMSERIYMLKQTLPTLLAQRKSPDKIMLNVTTSITEDEYDFYESLKEWDNKIEINYCNDSWRSCNKLIPALKKYPEADIITVDDDVRYPPEFIEKLYNKHLEYPTSIISAETCPILIKNNRLDITCNYSPELENFETFNRYFSRGTYFPSKTFENTEVLNYSKMFELTNGTHDELWFWVNTTLKGLTVVEEPLSWNFDTETYAIRHKSTDFQLSNINNSADQLNKHIERLNYLYGDKLMEIFKNNPLKCKVDNNNCKMIANSLCRLANLYKGYNLNLLCDENLYNGAIVYLVASAIEASMLFDWFNPSVIKSNGERVNIKR